jgi:hypothetical protein
MQNMYYLGLDVPKRTISYCVKDGSGRIYAEASLPATRFDLARLRVGRVGEVESNEREYVPARCKEWPLFPGDPNPYSSGPATRSPSDVVANPGSITMAWIVFPDCAMINCT